MVGTATTFEQGRKYGARVHLVGMEATFGRAVDVAKRLEAAGFTGTLVTGQPQAATPAARALPFEDGATFWASGVYTRPTATVELPPQIVDVWPVSSPGHAAAVVLKPVQAMLPAKRVNKPRNWIVLGALGYLLYEEMKAPRRRY